MDIVQVCIKEISGSEQLGNSDFAITKPQHTVRLMIGSHGGFQCLKFQWVSVSEINFWTTRDLKDVSSEKIEDFCFQSKFLGPT